MNFYSAIVTYKAMSLPFGCNEDRKLTYRPSSEEEKRNFNNKLIIINGIFGNIDGHEEPFSLLVYSAITEELKVVFSVDLNKYSINNFKKKITSYLTEHFDVDDISFSEVKEITVHEFNMKIDKASFYQLLISSYDTINALGTDYLHENSFSIKEKLMGGKKWSLSKAKEEATKILADKSLIEEIERIYSDRNEKKYYGNPVHYKVSASNMDSANGMIDVLVNSLRSNNRLLGNRVNKIYEITEGCYDEEEFVHTIDHAQGGVVVIDMSGTEEDHGSYASAYHEVIHFFDKQIEKYQVNTLFIFVELTENPGFSKALMSIIQEDVDIVELREGSVNREIAAGFIKNQMKGRGMKVTDADIDIALPDDKQLFSVGEAYSAINKIYKDSLKKMHYLAYEKVNYYDVKEKKCEIEPYKELMGMIGLTEVKKTVNDILNSAKVRKIRSEMGMDNYKPSMHMIFTGNTGTAKTTVARLLADILYKEEVMDGNRFVECGRADLVGKYVGWTAKTVRAKFREAKGGILFIDEAYALVDDSNSFGDEAINTIVQEMENHRDDVIVIFAGYPEKMKAFLDKNEGLRSRIAFHLDFPDYKAEELGQILDLMAGKKGYSLADGAADKCMEIFRNASQKKEFGNGRFVRTLLEQAEMAQAGRIMAENAGKTIDREALKVLKAEDFEVNAGKVGKDEKKIGFTV